MIDAIFRVLPEWAVTIIFVALIWYGANYIFLSDIALQSDLNVLRDDNSVSEKVKRCYIPLAVDWVSQNKTEYALHTSTFSLFPSEDTLIARMTNAVAAKAQACANG